MTNKPKYNFFKNTNYAISGAKDILKNESSFRIELIIYIFAILLLFFINIDLTAKLILFITASGVLIAEVINSGIERVVDLVTQEHNEMAGRAKDIGSTVVFFSILLAFSVWALILFNSFL